MVTIADYIAATHVFMFTNSYALFSLYCTSASIFIVRYDCQISQAQDIRLKIRNGEAK